MGQATVIATTDERRWFSALRPWVLLGGFVLVWWFLMTGAAQANGGPDGGLADTARSAPGTVERVVHHPAPRSATADKTRQPHRSPVADVTPVVRQRVDTVISPVAAPVASVAEHAVESNVEPVAARTTDAVRKVVKDVRSGLENGSAVVPGLNPDELVLPPLKAGESATRVGQTRSNETGASNFQTASSMLPAAGGVTALGSPAAAFDASPKTVATSGPDTATPTPAGGVNSDGSLSPADRDGASSTSGNGGPLVSDQNAEALIMTPLASATSTVTSVDRLPAGPAYPPASSPD
jgi:hypothetical protein